jgi:ATP-dependent RNA helicase DDX35
MQKELDEAREHFAVAEGDHVTFLNVYEGFRHASNPSQWCYKNCVNYQAMRKVMVVREQLSKLLQRLGVHLQSCGSDTEVCSLHLVLCQIGKFPKLQIWCFKSSFVEDSFPK